MSASLSLSVGAGVAARLSRIVTKEGVHLGLLPEADQRLVLAVAALGLPEGEPVNEAAANGAIKASLADELRCLHTDHVELRRWLCDTGWWQRDGYGRQYQRVPRAHLPASHEADLAALHALGDLPTWVQARRDELAAQKAARRQAWLDQQARASSANLA